MDAFGKWTLLLNQSNQFLSPKLLMLFGSTDLPLSNLKNLLGSEATDRRAEEIVRIRSKAETQPEGKNMRIQKKNGTHLLQAQHPIPSVFLHLRQNPLRLHL